VGAAAAENLHNQVGCATPSHSVNTMTLADGLNADRVIVLDGSIRIGVLRDQGSISADCIAPVKHCGDHRGRTSRLPAVLERQVVARALEAGLSTAVLAATFGIPNESIERCLHMLDGICPEAISLLSTSPVTEGAYAALRRFLPVRQVECARTMLCLHDFSSQLANSILYITPFCQHKCRPRRPPWSEDSARPAYELQQGLERIQLESHRLDATNAAAMLELTVIQAHIRHLLTSGRLVGWLARYHSEACPRLNRLRNRDLWNGESGGKPRPRSLHASACHAGIRRSWSASDMATFVTCCQPCSLPPRFG